MSVPWSALLYSGRATPPAAAHGSVAWGRWPARIRDLPGLARRSGHLLLACALALLMGLRVGATPSSAVSGGQTSASLSDWKLTAFEAEQSAEGYVGPVARSWTSRMVRAVLPAPATDPGQRLAAVGYIVQPGDSLPDLAQRFGLDPQTILSANPAMGNDPDALRSGDELLILPVDGVYYEAVAGDTVFRIASRYGVAAEVIQSFPGNGLREDSTIAPGQGIVIPGAVVPEQVAAAASSGPLPFLPDAGVPAESAAGSGGLSWPITGVFTQGYSGYHEGIDIATRAGTPVLAADAGYVASVGPYHAQYGNMVVINHGGGRQTLYAHLQSYAVEVGQTVEAQQVIGACGSTGNSTGPHLHFEVYENGVRQNPMNYLP